MVVVFDLDDTLYPEMEYVRSAYRAIARYHGQGLLKRMLEAPTPRAAFDSTGIDIDKVLDIYRNHMPDIKLPWQSLYVLARLSNMGCQLGLVTDGRSVTQRNKIRSLGLCRFMRHDLIMISEEIGSEKISGVAMSEIMRLTPGEVGYIYVGDNPAKDFLAGRRLGWTTVCLMNGGRGENLFSQNIGQIPDEYKPDFVVDSLLELEKILNQSNL